MARATKPESPRAPTRLRTAAASSPGTLTESLAAGWPRAGPSPFLAMVGNSGQVKLSRETAPTAVERFRGVRPGASSRLGVSKWEPSAAGPSTVSRIACPGVTDASASWPCGREGWRISPSMKDGAVGRVLLTRRPSAAISRPLARGFARVSKGGPAAVPSLLPDGFGD
jgi:hypothetical protein